jgi:hypothetical protein
MKDAPRDPLALTDWVIVDGSNLLHALTRGTDRLPAAALIGRLRGLIPGDISIDLIFDGPAERSLRGERIASGLRVRYSGPRSADDLIMSLVDEMRATAGSEATGSILVVSDDRDLRDRLRGRGARSAGTSWLIGRLERGRLASPSSGNPRPPRAPGRADDEDSSPSWQPGRGATSKRGPSRRSAKRDRG